MHAARAIHKQRERREEKVKLEVRRLSAASQISRFGIPRSPAVSLDVQRRRKNNEDSEYLNFSYVGFVVAAFGAVPLIVGTFVEVPALWEVGLGVTLVGIFIGLVFWCTELCAEAKKFSQKKKQLATRGKIEDSNLLQVPDRKFHHANGLTNTTSESRRGSFQSDSVSLISPAAHHFDQNIGKTPPSILNPNHLPLAHQGLNGRGIIGVDDSVSQYSSSDASRSDESSSTLHSLTLKANGHVIPGGSAHRKGDGGDGRVVSLVQQESGGLEDDSDSDAETVIEAPTAGKPTIIQVQSLIQRPPLFKGDSLTSVNTPPLVSKMKKPPLTTSFSLENETVAPLGSHHRTIRMPVMPQDINKLKRCECGRFLMDTDKLMNFQQQQFHHHGPRSMPSTSYSSPAWSLGPMSSRRVFGGPTGSGGGSSNSSGNDLSDTSAPFAAPPNGVAQNTRIISVTPFTTSAREDEEQIFSHAQRVKSNTRVPPSDVESVVEVEPTVSSSTTKDLFKKTETTALSITNGDSHTSQNASKEEEMDGRISSQDTDKVLQELLELTDITEPNEERHDVCGDTAGEAERQKIDGSNGMGKVAETDTKDLFTPNIDFSGINEISGENEVVDCHNHSVIRPTSLPIPPSNSVPPDNASCIGDDGGVGGFASLTVMSPTSSSSASTVVSTEANNSIEMMSIAPGGTGAADQKDHEETLRQLLVVSSETDKEEESGTNEEIDTTNNSTEKGEVEAVKQVSPPQSVSSEASEKLATTATEEMSLDELLDTLEQNDAAEAQTAEVSQPVAVK